VICAFDDGVYFFFPPSFFGLRFSLVERCSLDMTVSLTTGWRYRVASRPTNNSDQQTLEPVIPCASQRPSRCD
jgi:hypothetical protein